MNNTKPNHLDKHKKSFRKKNRQNDFDRRMTPLDKVYHRKPLVQWNYEYDSDDIETEKP